ncbi:unnamed protein product [Haemonchus placei]|uniref:SSD domain-containing protein n=1 Tax=Haemonchus placei TaxID=6290 RepID=A0A0N4X8M2_HAEPC|nr:unnamed protein product [Haemonchus placei]
MVFTKLRWAPLERPWADLVSKYCIFVARHPWPFIIIPCIVTALLSTGIFLNFKIVRGVHYLYSPLDARWKTEEAVFGENWAADDDHFYPGKDVLRRRGLYLIVKALDNGNVLRQKHAEQSLPCIVTALLSTGIFLNFQIVRGVHYLYSPLDARWKTEEAVFGENWAADDDHFYPGKDNECFSNTHARLIAEVYANGDQDHFNVTFPLYHTSFATEPVDVARTLGGVVLHGNRVDSAQAWLVLFQLKHHNPLMEKLSAEFENLVARAIEAGEAPGPLLDIYYFHSDTFDQELANENRRITPMFSITFSVLIVFSILCTFNIKWICLPSGVLSKPLMGVVGVVSALLAIISSTGLLLFLGVTFVDMCTVMPFLSLTIGIDDSFLMLAAWHETPRHLKVHERIGLSMRHAAVSISITTLTDALAFLIGAIAPLPAVKYFCFYSCAAIIFIFLYCLTMFVACLALQGRLEERNANSLLMGPDNRMWYQRFFEDYYAPFIANGWTVTLALLLFVSYATAAIIGSQRVIVGFDLINIVLTDSRPRHFLEIRKQYFPEDITRMDVAVMKPPRMAIATEREPFLHLLDRIEKSPCSAGRNSTEFWYFAFEKYIGELGFVDAWKGIVDDEEAFSENLRGFLMASDKYSYDVLRFPNGTPKAFRFATRLRNVPTDELIDRCAQWMR